MLGWAWCDFHKKHAETHYAELVFLCSVESAGHVVHSGASGVRNVDTLFSCLGGPGAVSIKSAPGTHYGTLVILHPVGSAGHVLHSGAFEAGNIDALFFMLRSAR
jgi:hypothetical protein